jgi:nucleoside phosphorylase
MKIEDLSRHIITFDADNFATHETFSIRTPKRTLNEIPWPAAKKPVPQPITGQHSNDALPKCDVLVVTWTVEEAKALSDVLTPGFNSKTSWYSYTKGYNTIKPILTHKSPALQSKRLGSYFMTKIGNKKVLCFKSELHMSTDGIKLPVKQLWQQIITESNPQMVITTGTAGGIGANVNLGDVVISQKVRFDCTRTFKNQPFHDEVFIASKNGIKVPGNNATIKKLLAANAASLPVDSPKPRFYNDKHTVNKAPGIVTTDFFAFDDIEDTYKLQKLGSGVEMGDAVLALVCKEQGTNAPKWLCIRNASDPEIKDNIPLKDQARKAAQIYEQYGYWTTVCSAIACWAVITNN